MSTGHEFSVKGRKYHRTDFVHVDTIGDRYAGGRESTTGTETQLWMTTETDLRSGQKTYVIRVSLIAWSEKHGIYTTRSSSERLATPEEVRKYTLYGLPRSPFATASWEQFNGVA